MMEFEYCDYNNPDHLTAVAEVIGNYLAHHVANKGLPLSKIQQLRLVDGLANQPATEVIFAINQDVVVGMAICNIDFSIVDISSYLNVQHLILVEQDVSAEVGKGLVTWLIEYARERELAFIRQESNIDFPDLHLMYRELGFVENNSACYRHLLKL